MSSDVAAGVKQWEIRAALRAYSRAGDDEGAHPAEQILTAALQLVREQEDFTVKALSESAGVALQTFYRHFGTKDELILAMIEENISRGTSQWVDSDLEGVTDPVERLRTVVTKPILIEYDETSRRLLQWSSRERARLAARSPAAVFEVHSAYRDVLLREMEAVIAAGLGSSPTPAVDAAIVQHQVLMVTHLAHGGGLEEPAELVAERVWQLFWGGFSATGGDSRS